MARFKKFTQPAVCNELRHNARQIKNNSNTDIDTSRTHLNYNLAPKRDMTAYQYFKQRKSELYCMNRADVKVMIGWIVTAPEDLKSEDEATFFKTVYDFMEDRYGKENIIQAYVHYDEGKTIKSEDRWGNPVETTIGRPHIHFCFIPATDDINPKHQQQEKICANDVLKPDIYRFHPELQECLDSKGIHVSILNGITQKNGRNYTVEELKHQTDLLQELERLRKLEQQYKLEQEHKYKGGRW